MWIDSHCHLEHFEEADQVIQRAHQAGVGAMLSICTTRQSFLEILPLAEKHPSVYASVGLHPTEVRAAHLEDTYKWLIESAAHPKVVGFGETGLDLMPQSPSLALQETLLHVHAEAALATNLPLIIHMRQAEEEWLAFMEALPQRPRGVLHCFTGSLECAKKAISWGWKISFSGILTFPSAKNLHQVAKGLPVESLLVETDAPWLAPQLYRGQKNEPAYVKETARVLADLKNVSLVELAHGMKDSFLDLFSKIKLS